MHYALWKVEQAVASLNRQISPAAFNPVDNEEDSPVWAVEKEKIRLQILEDLFSARNSRQLEMLTDLYQCSLTRLLDSLHPYLGANEDQSTPPLPRILYGVLQELLQFLQSHYPDYFNFSRKAPRRTILKNREFLKRSLEAVALLFSQHPENKELKNQVLHYLEKLAGSDSVCYGHLRYAARVLKAFQTDIGKEDSSRGEAAFPKLLVEINFNAPGVCSLLVDGFRTLAMEEPATAGKLRILQFHLKEISQVCRVPGLSLLPHHPCLKEQLLQWLREEIGYYEQELLPAPAASSPSAGKIHTSLSVPQLAFLFRLMKEEKLITNSNQSELLKVVSSSFTTAHKEQFSYMHLHGTFYKIEAHTKRSVYDLLIRLLHQSKKIG